MKYNKVSLTLNAKGIAVDYNASLCTSNISVNWHWLSIKSIKSKRYCIGYLVHEINTSRAKQCIK